MFPSQFTNLGDTPYQFTAKTNSFVIHMVLNKVKKALFNKHFSKMVKTVR